MPTRPRKSPTVGGLDQRAGVALRARLPAGVADHLQDVDLLQAVPSQPGDQRPAAHVAVLLAVEGDVADALSGSEGTGGGEQGGHAAGVVVGPRRAGDRVVVRPDQDPRPPGVAHDHVARLVHLDAEATGLDAREQVDDRPADGLVLGRAGGPWDADPLDDLPQVFRGDGGEGTPDGLGHRLRVGRGGHEPHGDDSQAIRATRPGTPAVRRGRPPGRSCRGRGCRRG